jgi:septum formation protein
MDNQLIDPSIKLVLGSKSPRRQELLGLLCLSFETRIQDIDESFDESLALSQIPIYIAQKKTEALKSSLKPNEILLCSDTIVTLENKVLGKASNQQEATEMLTFLSGKTHFVITGVCLMSLNKTEVFSVTTEVKFKKLTEEEIQFYILNFAPYDKAGAYGIQEWIGLIGVEELKGSFYNVMGLPVFEVWEKLKNWNLK